MSLGAMIMLTLVLDRRPNLYISVFKKMLSKSAPTVPLPKAQHRIRVDERASGGINIRDCA